MNYLSSRQNFVPLRHDIRLMIPSILINSRIAGIIQHIKPNVQQQQQQQHNMYVTIELQEQKEQSTTTTAKEAIQQGYETQV